MFQKMLDFLNHVHVLTLKNKDHTLLHKRYEALFPSRYTLFEVEGTVKSTNGGDIGSSLWKIVQHKEADATALDITHNHWNMIREAHSKGLDNVLFLEDDALFTPISPEKEARLQQWMLRHPHKWDIFFMGYCPWPMVVSMMVTRDVVRVYTPVCAHAYVLNRRGMEKMLHFLETPENRSWHFDKIFNMIPTFRKYAVFPMLSFQEIGPALYTKAVDQIGVSMHFTTLCRTLEWVSLLIPMVILGILVMMVLQLQVKK